MAWTSIPKPSLMGYVNVNPAGRQQYDQADIFYDSDVTYYDGFNPNQWTDVAKPSVLSWVNVPKPS